VKQFLVDQSLVSRPLPSITLPPQQQVRIEPFTPARAARSATKPQVMEMRHEESRLLADALLLHRGVRLGRSFRGDALGAPDLGDQFVIEHPYPASQRKT
jgi:hypothetical protein